MIWVIGSFTFVLAIGTAILWVASLVRRLSRSRLVIREFVNDGYKEIRCPSCTYGAQYIHPEHGRMPIPVSVRMVISGRDHMGTPQANISKCIDCGGNGWTTTRDWDMPDTGLREVR